jgi:hypothetical protein
MFAQGNNPPPSDDGDRTRTPSAIAERFGSSKARPKVVQVYNPRVGWSALAKRVPLTEELMAELRASGATMVDARWRSHRHRIPLLDLSLPGS